MKFLMLSFSFTVFVIGSLSCQDFYKKKELAIGFKIIPCYTTKLGHTYTYNKTSIIPNFALNFGVEVNKEINRNLVLMLDVNLINRGFTANSQKQDVPLIPQTKVEENLKYISLPLSLLYFNRNIFVGGGLFYEHLLIHNQSVNHVFTKNAGFIHYSSNALYRNLFGVQLKSGYRYNINDNLQLNIAAFFDIVSNELLANYGISASIMKKFN